jgi:hypothetical protein
MEGEGWLVPNRFMNGWMGDALRGWDGIGLGRTEGAGASEGVAC